MHKYQFFLVYIFTLSSSSSHAATTSSCPIDFNYINTFPWDTSTCTVAGAGSGDCCQTLRSLFGIGLAHHLKRTSTFYLPTPQSAADCISDFQSHLAVRHPFSGCFNSTDALVGSASNCAGIVTVSDWVDKLGPTRELGSSCNTDLTGLLRCRSCLEAGMIVHSRLVSLSPNSTKCFMLVALYAAGIVNSAGPENIPTATCILSIPLSTSIAKSRSKKNIIFASLGALIGVFLFLGVIIVYKRFKNKRKQTEFHRDYVRRVKARVLPNTGAKWFRIAELDVATNGFSQENFISHGGYGVVHKGTLSDGTLIAVKQLINLNSERDEDFVNEAEIISKIRHRNLLPLRGFCATSDPIKGNQRYLVYDFMPNGSLHDHIFKKNTLSWPQRKAIILDVAQGLSYLHNGIKPAIIHRDIKATNILLDSTMKALVADFGLAKQGTDGKSMITTRISGTYGYLAPEYALYGQLTEKSDVYSFGILVLEIMSGRKVLEETKGGDLGMVLISDWVWEMVRLDRIEEVFDGLMRDETLPKGVMKRFVRVGILCAHVMVALRPTVSEALKMLEGDIDIPQLPERPLPLAHESFKLNGNSLWSSSEGFRASSSLNTKSLV